MKRKVYFSEDKCMGCYSCVFACAVEHSKSKDALTAHTEKVKPISRRKIILVDGISVTTSCNHCENPICVEACIIGAIKKDSDGNVSFDTEKCTGCWMCIMVCPFGAINTTKTNMVKCDSCPDREGVCACVESCPTRALYIKP